MTPPSRTQAADNKRWTVINEARPLEYGRLTEYQEASRQTYRWRWLAELNAVRLTSRRIFGVRWFIRSRVVRT